MLSRLTQHNHCRRSSAPNPSAASAETTQYENLIPLPLIPFHLTVSERVLNASASTHSLPIATLISSSQRHTSKRRHHHKFTIQHFLDRRWRTVMHLIRTPFFLLPCLASSTLAENRPSHLRNDVDAILIDPVESPIQRTAPTPYIEYLNMNRKEELSPHLNNLELRQPAAPPVPNPAAPAANPVAPGAAPPQAGVGGAGAAPAAAQPAPGAQANPVTTILVQTVVGGVTKQVPVAFTQTFGAGVSAPEVQSGSIGLGTLTGQVGVVKTKDAKSEAVPVGLKGSGRGKEIFGVLLSMAAAFLVGGGVFGYGIGML